ncbi:MAG: amidophosphoribosyltransferase [Candidatus Diapherotrites archaeon]
MDNVGHFCGVAAVYLPKPLSHYPKGSAAYYLYNMLLQVQNRGQLSAGITTYNKERLQMIDTYKKLGTVNEAFRVSNKEKFERIMKRYSGDRGIGHTRYATSGLNDEGSAQPFERHHGRTWKWFSFGFNGNIANFPELKKKLEKGKYHLVRNNDTEIILYFLAKQTLGERRGNLRTIFGNLSTQFDGAYNLVYVNADGDLAAIRDPLGFRPLSYAKTDDFVGAASESCALTRFSENNVKTINPGEMLLVNDGSVEVKRFAKCRKKAFCMFEWVYFANAASILEGKSVYDVRWRLGQELAKIETESVDMDTIVVAVPDTARPAAESLSHEFGVPAMEGLLRNRYVGRTFIEGAKRDERVKEKFNINKTVLKGKKVILVEDSIVRGTTGKSLIDYIKREGKAKEVHMRVSCPPIRAPCFYGIDMSTMDELIATKHMQKKEAKDYGYHDVSEKTVKGIEKELGVDSLIYQKIDGLVKAIGLENGKRDLCMACLTGIYPTPWGEKLRDKANRQIGNCSGEKRTYE